MCMCSHVLCFLRVCACVIVCIFVWGGGGVCEFEG